MQRKTGWNLKLKYTVAQKNWLQ